MWRELPELKLALREILISKKKKKKAVILGSQGQVHRQLQTEQTLNVVKED